MRTSILAALLCLTGVFAQAEPMGRLVYECDQKHGDREAAIYHTGDDFYICFMRSVPEASMAPVEDYCKHKVWSDNYDYKNDILSIDFKHGWEFQGDRRSGVLWNDDTSYICRYPHPTANN